jgi:hypothetical protein
MPSRREWNAPPNGTDVAPAPYQLNSVTTPSTGSRDRQVASPAAVALAWITISCSSWTSSGVANAAPSARAVAARDGSVSTSVTVTPGIRANSHAVRQPSTPAPTTHARSPTRGAASHSALTAVSAMPASTARRAGMSGGTGSTAKAGTT